MYALQVLMSTLDLLTKKAMPDDHRPILRLHPPVSRTMVPTILLLRVTMTHPHQRGLGATSLLVPLHQQPPVTWTTSRDLTLHLLVTMTMRILREISPPRAPTVEGPPVPLRLALKE